MIIYKKGKIFLQLDSVPGQCECCFNIFLAQFKVLAKTWIGKNRYRVIHEGRENIEIHIFYDFLFYACLQHLDQGYKILFHFLSIHQRTVWRIGKLFDKFKIFQVVSDIFEHIEPNISEYIPDRQLIVKIFEQGLT